MQYAAAPGGVDLKSHLMVGRTGELEGDEVGVRGACHLHAHQSNAADGHSAAHVRQWREVGHRDVEGAPFAERHATAVGCAGPGEGHQQGYGNQLAQG